MEKLEAHKSNLVKLLIKGYYDTEAEHATEHQYSFDHFSCHFLK
jgi:hypothetical protein